MELDSQFAEELGEEQELEGEKEAHSQLGNKLEGVVLPRLELGLGLGHDEEA